MWKNEYHKVGLCWSSWWLVTTCILLLFIMHNGPLFSRIHTIPTHSLSVFYNMTLKTVIMKIRDSLWLFSKSLDREEISEIMTSLIFRGCLFKENLSELFEMQNQCMWISLKFLFRGEAASLNSHVKVHQSAHKGDSLWQQECLIMCIAHWIFNRISYTWRAERHTPLQQCLCLHSYCSSSNNISVETHNFTYCNNAVIVKSISL